MNQLIENLTNAAMDYGQSLILDDERRVIEAYKELNIARAILESSLTDKRDALKDAVILQAWKLIDGDSRDLKDLRKALYALDQAITLEMLGGK